MQESSVGNFPLKTWTAIFATAFLIVAIVALDQRHVIATDTRILNSWSKIVPGMTHEQVNDVVGRDSHIHPLGGEEGAFASYQSRHYMGVVTSRNLVVYYNEEKKVVFVSWEHT